MEVYYKLLDEENGYLMLRPNCSTFFRKKEKILFSDFFCCWFLLL